MKGLSQTEKIGIIAKMFFDNNDIIHFKGHFYLYKNGYWKLESDENTIAWANKEYKNKHSEFPPLSFEKTFTKYIEMYTYDNPIYRDKIEKSEIRSGYTINTKSGILDLETLEMEPYTKEAFCFYKLDYDYIPNSKCPQMMKFLMSSLECEIDDGRINLLQEWAGYILSTNIKLDKCLILFGDGANGKGTYIKILQYILTEHNYSIVDLKYINDGSQIFMTRNKLVNFSGDLEQNVQFDTGIIKEIIENKPVNVNEKFKSQILMPFTAKLMIACNSMPFIKSPGESVRRRIHILEFHKKFVGDERDDDLDNKLQSEAEQIFSWAVDGLLKLRKTNNFTEPKECLLSMKEYIANNDNIELWISEDVIKKENGFELAKDLHLNYIYFCDQSRLKAVGKITFYKRLENKGYKRIKGPGNADGFKGLYLTNTIK